MVATNITTFIAADNANYDSGNMVSGYPANFPYWQVNVEAGALLDSPSETALFLVDGPFQVQVDGQIGANSDALYGLYADALDGLTLNISGTGIVDGDNAGIYADCAADITNAGTVSGDFYAIQHSTDATFSLNNSGSVTSLDLAISVTGAGTHTVTNSGIIEGFSNSFYSLAEVVAADLITNDGTMSGNVSLGGGDDSLTNSGTITGWIYGGDGNNSLVNTGAMDSGLVDMGAGDDDFTNTGTIVTQGITMGAGNDTFTGGVDDEAVLDAGGNDSYSLGGGNDRYFARSQYSESKTDLDTDTISGGGNRTVLFDGNYLGDVYDLTYAMSDAIVNMSGVTKAGVAAGNAVSMESGTDIISGFESVNGGDGDDRIFGSEESNVLSGSWGNDRLVGMGGDDWLIGGQGDDMMRGGLGADRLDGGFGNDTYHYEFAGTSPLDPSGRDTVVFEDNADAFIFGGALAGTDFLGQDLAFSGTAGDLRVMTRAFGWAIQVDQNGDGRADMAIRVEDANHAIIWDAGDFGLI